MIVAVSVLLVSVIAFLTTAPRNDAPAPTTWPKAAASPSKVPSATPAASAEAAAETLARAAVYLEVRTPAGETTGSGALVSSDGLVLTNAHLVDPVGDGKAEIEVGMAETIERKPRPEWRAEIVASDPALDLAVIRITETLAGTPLDAEFFRLTIGDSDALAMGDALHILGYPDDGAAPIAYTTGEVSGVVSDATLGERAWIKTDAEHGGIAGGLATDEYGALIGIVTGAAGADCRVVADSNDDGAIDADDDCESVAGFSNGIRPVAFAADLLAAAASETDYERIGSDLLTDPATVGELAFRPAVMASAVDPATNTAVDQVEWLPSGSTRVCAVWEFSGMPRGASYDAIWMIDGEIAPGLSYLSQTWAFEPAGSFWTCATAGDEGLDDGEYTATVLVDGKYTASGWIFIGDDYEPTAWSLENHSSLTFCYVFVSPTSAPTYGVERLGEERLLENGDGLELELTPGDYDVLIRDCELAEIYADTVTVEPGGVLSLSD